MQATIREFKYSGYSFHGKYITVYSSANLNISQTATYNLHIIHGVTNKPIGSSLTFSWYNARVNK